MVLNFLEPLSGWGGYSLYAALGAVFIVHGLPKVKDPSGIAQAAWKGNKTLGMLHGLVEVVGGASLILAIFGVYVFTAELTFLLALIMLGAIYFKVKKWHMPFFSQQASGWEFDLVVLTGLLALLLG